VRRLAILVLPLLVAMPLAAAPRAPAPPAAGTTGPPQLLDRVVAVVDEDPILLSDLDRAIGLGTIARQPDEGEEAFRRRALDRLIEWRLQLHAIARFGFEEAPLEEVDRQLAELEAKFPTAAGWQRELARLNLTEAQVREILARQLSVLSYVEQRLGPRVFVDVDDIRKYYEETLVPKLEKAGQPVPPIEKVREAIRSVLREQRLDQEIDRWTRQLREQADVVDLLDQEPEPLPPVVGTIGPP